MKQGLKRFEFYLTQLETMLVEASAAPNPGLWLYKNDARTVFFMIEGLSRLYEGLHNSKRFAKLKDKAKAFEDILGSIDYYDKFALQFSKNKSIPATVKAYLKTKTATQIRAFNDLLVEKEWLESPTKKINKIRSKIKKSNWLLESEEGLAITKFYEKEIDDIIIFYNENKTGFTELESQVHEIRRNLRWLSIYPRTLQGVVKFKRKTRANEKTKKYLTQAVINSPFNKLPVDSSLSSYIYFEQNYFYGLSWIIDKLGKLKDNGLRIFVLTEALQHTRNIDSAAAHIAACKLLKLDTGYLDKVLQEASRETKPFFENLYLQKLIIAN